MNIISHAIERLAPHTAPLLALACIATLGSAYTFQYFGYEPCTLCYYQRYPYMAVILMSGIAWALSRRGDAHAKLVLMLVAASITALFLDAGIAAYHVGVEQKFWTGPSTCSAGAASAASAEQLLQQLQSIRLVRCDEPAWSLFGISMAGYNFFIALGLGILAVQAWPHLQEKTRSQ